MPLKKGVPQGWYLVFWRVISVDGHPVRGAFTFAVGPRTRVSLADGVTAITDGDHGIVKIRAAEAIARRKSKQNVKGRALVIYWSYDAPTSALANPTIGWNS